MADVIAHYGGGCRPGPGESRCVTVSYTCGACDRHVSLGCFRASPTIGRRSTREPPDTPRYKALGNSMAVPCMRWIGERIQMVDEILGGENVQVHGREPQAAVQAA